MPSSTLTSVNQLPPLFCQDFRIPGAKLFPTRPLHSLLAQTVPGPPVCLKPLPPMPFPTTHYTSMPHLDPAVIPMQQDRLHAADLPTVILQHS